MVLGSARFVPTVVVLILVAVHVAVGVNGAVATLADAPAAITFPDGEGPHDVRSEWWYYTGHLFTANGERYGFEFVFFRARIGQGMGHAGHFAITDNARGRFRYDQRATLADDVVRPAVGFDLAIGDWSMRGHDGHDRLVAAMAGYAIDLDLIASKPPALHGGDGYLAYADDAGSYSYYYSRTRMTVSGTLTVDGVAQAVTGEAWMDHQWGDFANYLAGGWDWFAVQLDDGTDLMLYLLRDESGDLGTVEGTLVATDGTASELRAGDFSVEATGSWTSPRTGATYPQGWTIALPADDLMLTLTPALADQELDTRATTTVIYWEGEVTVAGTREGEPVAGLGYVELTGYAQ